MFDKFPIAKACNRGLNIPTFRRFETEPSQIILCMEQKYVMQSLGKFSFLLQNKCQESSEHINFDQ